MSDTTNHYEYRCTKCHLLTEVMPVLMHRMIDGVTLLSLCCLAEVTTEVVSSKNP